MANNNSYDEAVQTFNRYFSNLDELLQSGYVSHGIENVPATKVVPESFKLILKNEAKIRVEIIFYPLPNELGIILFYIWREDKKEPINLKDWLKKHGKLKKGMFKLETYSGNLDEKMKAISENIGSMIVDQGMRDILEGKDWEDIPFDWTGLK